jgi:replicative DNA helicase
MTKNKFDFEGSIQKSIIYLSKSDVDFFHQISALVKSEYFDSVIHQRFYSVIKDHFYEFQELPNDSQILEETKKHISEKEFFDDYRSEVTDINRLDVETFSDKEYYIGKIEEFAKQQAMREAILDSVDLLKDGEFEKIKDRISKALITGRHINLGSDYFNTVDYRYEKLKDTSFVIGKTPFKVLNEKLDCGGLGRGELGIVVAPTGVGKSMYLVNQAVQSLLDGLNVVYVSLEMSEERIAQRFDARLTYIPIPQLIGRVVEVKSRLMQVKNRYPNMGKIKIKQFPSKALTISQLRAYLQQLKNYEQLEVDILIVDYIDLMSGSIGSKTYEAQQELSEYLRGMATEMNIAVWTATQTNREGHKVDIITEKEIGDSYGKIRPCELIFSLNQTAKEKDAGIARLWVMKNRNGPSKFIHKIRIDGSVMSMKDYTEEDEE